MWRRNEAQATGLSSANCEHSKCCLYCSPTLAERHLAPGRGHTSLCTSSRSFQRLPSQLYLCTLRPPLQPAIYQPLFAPGPLTQILLDFSCVSRPVTITTLLNCSCQLSWFRLNQHKQHSDSPRGRDLFRQHKHGWRGPCPPAHPSWPLRLAGQGAEQLLWVPHVHYDLLQHHPCSPTCSSGGNSTRSSPSPKTSLVHL